MLCICSAAGSISCELYGLYCGLKSGSSACGDGVDLSVRRIALKADFTVWRAFFLAFADEQSGGICLEVAGGRYHLVRPPAIRSLIDPMTREWAFVLDYIT
jgi:hypothetical protein